MNYLIGEGRFDIKKITSTGDHLIPCNSINHKYLDDEKAFISDCPEVVTYIKNIFTEHLKENETYRCKYLNYSINSVVKNNENQKYKEKTLIEAYSRLATNLSVCKDSIKTIEDSVFYNVKELSDIYYKFKNHIKIINDYETTDCQDLYHIVKSYLNIKSTCRDEKNKFCDAVDKFKIDCLSKIKKIKCKHVEYNLKPFPTWDVNTIVEFEEAEAEAQPQERQDRANVVEDVKEGGVDTEETARSSHIGIPDVDHNGDSLKDNASNPVRTITYTSLGLILPLATLYRVKKYLKNLIILYEY
ncbi:hypothetical protein PVNG_03840 [Plasmodium vivax North Korean]|uniref:Variable surface protein n=1 Tax=Plasmodium vivax North Korean TaxID=1035514 RepID=A0A0J9TUH7_PLAVI|nr:hypothetical protein PVNG_03840 [Plasmodium vivax North Korean]